MERTITVTTLANATLMCDDCGHVALAYSLFAHLVLRHGRLPRPNEVPPQFEPTEDTVCRLRYQIIEIVIRDLAYFARVTAPIAPAVVARVRSPAAAAAGRAPAKRRDETR